jgi:hypothetical protein
MWTDGGVIHQMKEPSTGTIIGIAVAVLGAVTLLVFAIIFGGGMLRDIAGF